MSFLLSCFVSVVRCLGWCPLLCVVCPGKKLLFENLGHWGCAVPLRLLRPPTPLSSLAPSPYLRFYPPPTTSYPNSNPNPNTKTALTLVLILTPTLTLTLTLTLPLT